MRQGLVLRETRETNIEVALNLDGTGQAKIHTGIGFFDHMLEQLAVHSGCDLTVQAQGDLHIDGHHTVEDVGICLGQCLAQACLDKNGLTRFGHAYVPLDEALSRTVIDISGRPGLALRVNWTAGQIGTFDTQLVAEFFQGLVNHAAITVHIDNLFGSNAHHQCESIFKSFAHALKHAVRLTGHDQIPSSKGLL